MNISNFSKLTRHLNKTCYLTCVELIIQQTVNMSVSHVIIRAAVPLWCEIKYSCGNMFCALVHLHVSVWILLHSQTCFSAEDLLRIHRLNSSSLTRDQFTQISPALIQQILSGGCSEISPAPVSPDSLSTAESESPVHTL